MTEQPPLPRRIACFAPWTWRRRWIVASAFLLAFVAYPLSLGPMQYLLYFGFVSFDVYVILYKPVFSLAAECPALAAWLWWYLDIMDPARGR